MYGREAAYTAGLALMLAGVIIVYDFSTSRPPFP